MRYLGGKSKLLDTIYEMVVEYTTDTSSIIDLFAGTGVVSKFFKAKGFKVYANDFLYFSYVLNHGTIDLNEKPKFRLLDIKNPIEYLNCLSIVDTDIPIEKCFIYQNYSPNEHCQRMYFQNKNAIKIDLIRITIENWYNQQKINEEEYFYLLASLISAVPFVSNIAGVYGAYLKQWDHRSFKDLILKEPEIINAANATKSFNLDYVDLLKNISADVLYADPPYNSRQYLPNYHVLETIAKYDYPSIKGVTGMRDYSNQKSQFCMKTKVKNAFETMIKEAQVRYIVISYNNESLLTQKELEELCMKYAKENTFKLIEKNYKRYTSKIPNKKEGLKEQIYIFEKAAYNEK